MLGLDYLGLANKNWKVKESLAAFPSGWALGCFARTFGDAMPNVKTFLDSGKVAAFRLQAWWDNGHKIAPLAFLQAELPRWEMLAREYPHIPFYISHSCEYSEQSLPVIRKRVDMVRKLCPSCKVVQAPYKSPIVKGEILEQHGSKLATNPGGIVSTDGISICDIDARSWINQHSTAEITFLWAPRFNLREAVKPPAVQPLPHKRTAYPSREYIKGIVWLANDPKSPPAPSFEARPLKKPELWKTYAEDSPGEDSRHNKPLALLKNKTESVDIVTYNNKKIGSLKYYGTYSGGLFRFYSGLPGGSGDYAFQIAKKAIEESGSEWVWLKQGKTYIGPIPAGFRVPFYQK